MKLGVEIARSESNVMLTEANGYGLRCKISEIFIFHWTEDLMYFFLG